MFDYKVCRLNNIEIQNVKLNNVKTGQRLAIDEVVNQGVVIQFLGFNEFQGNLTGIINYRDANIDTLQEVLNSQVIAFLELPFGEKYKIFIEENRSNFYQDTLGQFVVDFSFYTSALSTDNVIVDIKDVVLQESGDLKLSLLDRFANLVVSVVGAVNRVKGQISTVLTTIQSITATFSVLTDAIANFQDLTTSIENTIDELINSPARLINAFDSLVSSFKNIFENDDDKIEALSQLTEQIEIPKVKNSGPLKQQETENANLFAGAVFSSAIANYIEMLILRDFVYDFEIKKYIEQIQKMLTKAELINDNELRIRADNLLNTGISFLKDKNTFVKKEKHYTADIITTERLLCYNIYGNVNDELIENIRKWNDLKDYSYIQEGQVVKYYI